MWVKILSVFAIAAMPQLATAAETITYTYDAKGRVVRIVQTGSINNGTTKTYDHDKADNRQRVLVTGSPR